MILEFERSLNLTENRGGKRFPRKRSIHSSGPTNLGCTNDIEKTETNLRFIMDKVSFCGLPGKLSHSSSNV